MKDRMGRFMVYLLLLSACGPQVPRSSPEITYRAVEDGEIWFKNSSIQLRFDYEMYCRVSYLKDGRLLSINDIPIIPSLAKPTHFIEVNGKEIKDFRVDYRNVGVSDIRTPLGTGKRLHLTGYVKTEEGLTIEKNLSVELYQDLPETSIFTVSYRNAETSQPIRLTKIVSNFFRMDAARLDANTPRYAFMCFQGLEPSHLGAHPRKVTADFFQALSTRILERGAPQQLPFMDLWTEEMGMAVGDLSNLQEGLTLQVQVASDQRVEISMQSREGVTLGPNEDLPHSKSFLMVHSGDYQIAWEKYRDIQRLLTHKPTP
jgi:hypothetical protein